MTPKEQTHEYKIGESFNLSSISSDLHWNEENELSDYEFKYWTETEEDTGTKYADKSSITFLEKTADLYAQWDRTWFKFKYDKNIIENDLIMKGTSGAVYKFDPYSPDIDRKLQYCSSYDPFNPTTPYSNITELQDKNNLVEVNDENGVMSSIGDNAFYYCPNLYSVNCPEVTNIGIHAFSDCIRLASINCSSVTSICYFAFSGCMGLSSVNIQNVDSIGEESFSACSNLSSINIPNVTSIGSSAFHDCLNLSTIDFSERILSTIPTLEDYDQFESIPSDYRIIVPSRLYEEWKLEWDEIASHIVAV